MLAGWYDRCGPADEVISIGEAPDPTPGPGEVLVRLMTSGINPSDYKRRGNTKAPLEFARVIPHSDGAGVVAAVGAGVDRFREGDRVWTFHAQWGRANGTAAQYVALPAALVQPLPQNVSFEQGACLGIPAMTGYRCAMGGGSVMGKTVYVPAAAGRVGAYAIQFAKLAGARVIASASGQTKMNAARELGADVVLERADPDLARKLLNETGGRGVDRIVEIDLPGNILFNESVLADGGSIATYGSSPKPQVTLTLSPRRARNFDLQIVFVYTLAPALAQAVCEGVIAAALGGRLTHRIAGVVPLPELARAHREAESQTGSGHMIVSIP
ncbi:MAG: NADPH:quinone reductase [Beijerinckiaceae bacterium]|nr:NADPH:quinone reductase [Beijerinckiaceae bacterium]